MILRSLFIATAWLLWPGTFFFTLQAQPCESTLTITADVPAGSTDTRKAKERITATNTVENAAAAIYQAGNAVVFKAGFHARNGAYLHADNNGCTNGPVGTKITLPIEVIGQQGKIVERRFDLNATQKSRASALWFMVNNLGYENKGSIRVNDGMNLALNHNNVQMDNNALARGGMVHGGFNTIKFTIPASDLVTGNNVIRFRFDKSDGISNGYRVVRMNVLDAGGNKLLPENTFEEDDPNTWAGPYTDNASIQAGKDLWENATLWNHNLPNRPERNWYSYQLPASRIIRAKCSSCHTQDGRDLEIFSYSNESIIERAKFHKLSEEDGKKIASYIRSLSGSEPNVGRYGRPWNPPYQPGPALKNKPIEQWAAGAGIDAVLEKDADMLPYLFPEGINREKVEAAFDNDKMYDRTIIPVAVQFPDWKHWLPIIHPIDAYSKNGYIESGSRERKPLRAIETLRNYLNARPVSERDKNELKQKIYDLWEPFRKFFEEGTNDKNHWRSKGGSANQHLAQDVPLELAKTSLARLFAVTHFEIMNVYNLQDKAHWWVRAEDQPGDRQWPSLTYSVFEVPPHFTATDSRKYVGQSSQTGFYESTAWYNLQFVLNGGNGMVGGTTPTDFNYNAPFIGFAAESSGIEEPLRYFSSISQMYQIRTWFGQGRPGGTGFRIRFQGPWAFLGITDANKNIYDNPTELLDQLRDIDPNLDKWILEALLKQFIAELNNPDNNLSSWPRWAGGSRSQNHELEPAGIHPAEVRPVRNNDRVIGNYVGKMQDALRRLKARGNVDCGIINTISDWCKRAWPNIAFERCSGGARLADTHDRARIKNGSAAATDLVALYPNPFEHSLYLRINEPAAGRSYYLELYDAHGSIVHQQHIGSEENRSETNTTVSVDVTQGLYFLTIYDGQGNPVHTEKVFKY